MNNKNVIIISIPIIILIVFFFIDTLTFGIDNSHLNVINIFIIIILYSIGYWGYIIISSKKINRLYEARRFDEVISKGLRFVKYIIIKNSKIHSIIYLYISVSSMLLDDYEEFDKYISFVENRKCHMAKFFWTCYRYYLNKDFKTLKEVYESENIEINKTSIFYNEDILMKGVIAYSIKDYVNAKRIFKENQIKFVSNSARLIFDEIMKDIDFNTQ